MQELRNNACTSTLWGWGGVVAVVGPGPVCSCSLRNGAGASFSPRTRLYMWIVVSVKKLCVPQTADLQRDPPPVLQPAPARRVVVGVVFCASLGPCACTMLYVRMAFPSDGGSRGGNSTAFHPMWPHRIHAIPDSHQGCRSRTLRALVVPVGLALIPTLNTLGSPLAPKPVRPRLAGACPV